MKDIVVFRPSGEETVREVGDVQAGAAVALYGMTGRVVVQDNGGFIHAYGDAVKLVVLPAMPPGSEGGPIGS
jgi:hypothetical protein